MAEQKLKVYGCRTDSGYKGGLIIVAAPNRWQAFLTAVFTPQTRWLFEQDEDDDSEWYSDIYPYDEWVELEGLSTNLKKNQVISEYHYSC